MGIRIIAILALLIVWIIGISINRRISLKILWDLAVECCYT